MNRRFSAFRKEEKRAGTTVAEAQKRTFLLRFDTEMLDPFSRHVYDAFVATSLSPDKSLDRGSVMRFQHGLGLFLALTASLALTRAQDPGKTTSPVAAGKTVDLTGIDRKILEEPIYVTGQPKYCLLVFGDQAKTRVWLVRDGSLLYVDRNSNRHLGEAGERVVGDVVGSFKVGDMVEQPSKTKHTSLIVHANPRHRESVTVLIDGKRMQTAFFKSADRPSDAPIIHLNGPVTLRLHAPAAVISGKVGDLDAGIGPNNKLRRGWEVYLNGYLGTPGVNAFAMYRPSEVLPQPRLSIEVEFSEKDAAGRGLRARGFLAAMSANDFTLEGGVRVPDKAHVGDVDLTVTLPDNKEVGGVPLVIRNIWMRD